MKLKGLIPAAILLFSSYAVSAQKSAADSIKVVKVFKELIYICKNVDFGDPKVSEQGLFYKAAPYIIYRGEDKARSWKSVANYNNPEEKKGVDEVCYKINNSVNQDSTYKILSYSSQTESEGTWHVLMVSYIRKGKEKKAAYAFLKIKENFALGDIDVFEK